MGKQCNCLFFLVYKFFAKSSLFCGDRIAFNDTQNKTLLQRMLSVRGFCFAQSKRKSVFRFGTKVCITGQKVFPVPASALPLPSIAVGEDAES